MRHSDGIESFSFRTASTACYHRAVVSLVITVYYVNRQTAGQAMLSDMISCAFAGQSQPQASKESSKR